MRCSNVRPLAIGPGISRNPETAEFVRTIVTRTGDKSMVVDADGLNAFEGAAEQAERPRTNCRHHSAPGRNVALDRLEIAEIQANRLEVARNFAREHELIVVLKGHRTLIVGPRLRPMAPSG